MYNALIGLLISLIFFGITTIVLFGWGGLIARLFQIKLPKAEGFFSQLWIGWAVILLLLQLLNFVMPLDWLATTLITVGGLIALWFNRREFMEGDLVSFHLTGQSYLYLGVLFLSTCWIALQSMREPTINDTGLYHLQSVRWYNEYAIVPGLGNLHGRFAFNQSFFAFAAALNLYPYLTFGNALASGFLILLYIAESLYLLIYRRGEHSLTRFAAIFTLPVILFLVLRQGISSPAPDTASTILQLVIWLYFVRTLEERSPALFTRSRIHVIFILSAAAVTVKLSNVVFVAVIGVILLIREWKSDASPLGTRIVSYLQFFWFPLLLLVVWIGRGYILSGYPLYPSTIGRINVDWALPVDMAEREAFWIWNWPRFGRAAVQEGFFAWVKPWAQNYFITAKATLTYPLALTLLASAAYEVLSWLLSHRRNRRNDPYQAGAQHPLPEEQADQPAYWLVYVPIFLGLIFWWFSAPDPRFARALLWLLPIVTTYFLLQKLDEIEWGTRPLNSMIAFLVVNGAFLAIIWVNWSEATEISAGFAPAPRVELVAHTLPGSLVVWLPSERNLCWNSELPCAAYVNELLRLRGSTFQDGFKTLTEEEALSEQEH